MKKLFLIAILISFIIVSSVSLAKLTTHIEGINAKDISGSADRGTLKAFGVPILNPDEAKTMKNNRDISVEVNIEGTDKKSRAINIRNPNSGKKNKNMRIVSSLSELEGPDIDPNGGRSAAYVLSGWRWNQANPQLKFYLLHDSNIESESLNIDEVQSAVTIAANTWDASTNQNLFADSNLVTISSTVAADKYNKINTINWKLLTSTCLAYSRTWYNYNLVDGYKTALDSDLVFNTKYVWHTDGSSGGVDVQSIALHELGHTLGLGDLYGKPEFSEDGIQVMHCYNALIKRVLGNGDKTGLWILYDNGYVPPVIENLAPSVPVIPSGQDTGLINVDYSFSTYSTDPDNDQISYVFDWGDGTVSSNPDGLVGSGVTVSAKHCWSTEGIYSVKAKAIDSKGEETSWSESKTIEIIKENTKPESLQMMVLDATYTLRLEGNDPDGDKIRYVVNWGDGVEIVTPLIDPGLTTDLSHNFEPGVYNIRFKVIDEEGLESEWSDLMEIKV